jgi:stage IV sporulation protein FB
LTGLFKEACIFTIIIVIHEIGHIAMAFLLKWQINSINLYPYGGLTKFDEPLNKSLGEELLITIMGPITQIIFFGLIEIGKIGDTNLIRSYHYGILFFNLLPIYPLDGGKLSSLLLQLIFPYKKSLRYVVYFSYLNIIFLFLYLSNNFILSFFLITVLLIFKLIEEHKKINYYFNKFILERYLHRYSFKKKAIISNLDQFYRNKSHIIKKKDKYLTERSALAEKFKKNQY